MCVGVCMYVCYLTLTDLNQFSLKRENNLKYIGRSQVEQKYNGRLYFSLVRRKCVAVEGRPTISKAGMLIAELKVSRKTWRKHDLLWHDARSWTQRS